MSFRKFTDTNSTRELIFRNLEDAFNSKKIEGRATVVSFKDVEVKRKHFSLEDQKKAILHNKDLHVPIRGIIELRDKNTGKLLDQKKTTLAQVPYLTPRGTFIRAGNEYATANQFRLKPGVYTLVKENEEVESHFNLAPGKGLSFRVVLDPKDYTFRANIAQAKIPIFPLFKAMGFSDQQLISAWGGGRAGKEILKANKRHDSPVNIDKLYNKIYSYKKKDNLSTREKVAEILRAYNQDSMSSAVNQATLGMPSKRINPNVLLKSTSRLVAVYSKKEAPDDRDSLQYRTLHGVEDFLRERIDKDAGKLSRKLANKVDAAKSLAAVPSSYYTRAFHGFMNEDSKVSTTEQLNPMEILESQLKTTPLGEGGLSLENVPKSLRNVHPTQLSFVDPVRAPESEKAGIDLKVTHGTLKGSDGFLYSEFINAKTGKKEKISTENLHKYVVAFPGEWQKSGNSIRVMRNQDVTYADRKKVDYYIPDASKMFTATTNMVPFLHNASGNRILMAAKTIPQALPLLGPEAPLVRAKMPDKDESFDFHFGKLTSSAAVSPVTGKILRAGKTKVDIADNNGKKHTVELYNNFPFNVKTGITQDPIVKPGQKIKAGDVVARSNFTDEKGVFAYGKNLNVGYLPYKGYNFEDGVVISETAANKLTSEHMYTIQIDITDTTKTGKDTFVSIMPTAFTSSNLNHIDRDGVAIKGSKLSYGQPIILALEERTPTATDISLGRLHKALKVTYRDISEVWAHHGEGEVVEVIKSPKFYKVIIRSSEKMTIGDKITGRHGNKGVVTKILPDSHMPRTKDGPLEVLLNPQGIITRINPSQVYETLLGKVAYKTGKPYLVENFKTGDSVEYVGNELKKHGVPDQDDVSDPISGKKLGKVLTGRQYLMKTSATAEKAISARASGSYTSELRPVKGKSFGMMEMNALVAHNARKFMKDAVARKSERNDDLWRAVRFGQPLPAPQPTFATSKFIESLKAAGVNVKKEGSRIAVMPLTDKEVENISAGRITNAKGLKTKDLSPETGGLFDEAVTGGADGQNWSHFELAEPLPNPITEDNIKVLLDLTSKQFEDVLEGRRDIGGRYGGDAIKAALLNIDLDRDIRKLKADLKVARKTHRNKIIKKLRILLGAKKMGVHPSSYVISKVPVLPPIYRPIVPGQKGFLFPAQANDLYKETILANESLATLKDQVADDDADLHSIRGHTYKSLKALYGMGTPQTPKLARKNVKGFLKQIVGDSPKTGMFQSKVVKKEQDFSARAVIIPDPKLKIDEAGIPEELAWEIFEPFVTRKLTERGYMALDAKEMIERQDPIAKKFLLEVMNERPIVVNRAPSLHRYNLMALKPKISSTRALSLPPLIEKGFNADHDGDQMNIHVPVSDDAVEEVKETMMPSKNLFQSRRRNAYWVPEQEAVLGLYRATKNPVGKIKRTFNTKQEAMAAYNRGEIAIDDPIEVRNLT